MTVPRSVRRSPSRTLRKHPVNNARLWTWIWALTVAAACASPTRDRSPDRAPLASQRVLDSLARVTSCTAPVQFTVNGADSLTERQRCALIQVAWRAVASGVGAHAGVEPSDTAKLARAAVTPFFFHDTSGNWAQGYWSVDFKNAEGRTTVSAHVDGATGAVTLGRAMQ
jgi:hypothetical protein